MTVTTIFLTMLKYSSMYFTVFFFLVLIFRSPLYCSINFSIDLPEIVHARNLLGKSSGIPADLRNIPGTNASSVSSLTLSLCLCNTNFVLNSCRHYTILAISTLNCCTFLHFFQSSTKVCSKNLSLYFKSLLLSS